MSEEKCSQFVVNKYCPSIWEDIFEIRELFYDNYGSRKTLIKETHHGTFSIDDLKKIKVAIEDFLNIKEDST